MELTKVNGNTFYINAPTNIGVYSYKNKNCLLIDTGINNSAARKIDDVLISNSLHVKYIINTHSHYDHCGGNPYFQNTYPGSLVYASSKERLHMENVDLRPSMLFSSVPARELEAEFKDLHVDYTLEYGTTKIKDDKFEVIDLRGHSPESIGIITNDRVCFLGDAIYSDAILNKYRFPYVYNVDESIQALNKIREIDADYFVLSHAEDITGKDEIDRLVDKNIANYKQYEEQILEFLEKPLTKEGLLENLITLNDLYVSFRQYYLYYSSMSAFMASLLNRGIINHFVEGGQVYYSR